MVASLRRLLFTSSATESFMVEHLSEQALFAKRRKRPLIRSIIVDVRCATTILSSKKITLGCPISIKMTIIERNMFWLKIIVTAVLVGLISEIAQWSDRMGAVIAALPIMTLMILLWMHFEGQSQDKLALHARYTFWYVLPTLPMFYCFPLLLQHLNFWGALIAGVAMSLVLFLALGTLLQRFDVHLW